MGKSIKGKTASRINGAPKTVHKGPLTALVLSGGGSRGAYQIGAWQAICELGIRIDMVAGVSVGALNAAMVAQGDLFETEALWRRIETDTVFDVDKDAELQDFALEFLKQGGAGSGGLKKLVDRYISEEAVRSSAVDFGLLTVEVPAMEPRYLWKSEIPEGLLGDFIMASASAFPAVQRYRIAGREYIDGGYTNNMPIHMAVDHGAERVISVFLKAPGRFDPKEYDCAPELVRVEPQWDLGSFLIFTRKNTARIMRLGYLDTMKAFGVFDGRRYTFVKGAFDRRSLRQAEAAALSFRLDPLVLYRREYFIKALGTAIAEALSDIAGSLDAMSDIGPDVIKNLLKQANRRSAVMLIARDIKEKGADSIFLSRASVRLLDESVNAARFLQKYGLV